MFLRISHLLSIAMAFLVAGCFEVTGRHELNFYGDSDNGTYSIRFNQLTYGMLASSDDWGDAMRQLRTFSNPRTRYSGDYVYVEDRSGQAAMEHFYDDFSCYRNNDGRTANCSFAFNFSNGNDAPGWSVDWEVVVRPEMRIISSNHHRSRTRSGYRYLYWDYEYARHSGARVEFTVQVPIAR